MTTEDKSKKNNFLCLDQLLGKMVDKVQPRRTVMRIKFHT